LRFCVFALKFWLKRYPRQGSSEIFNAKTQNRKGAKLDAGRVSELSVGDLTQMEPNLQSNFIRQSVIQALMQKK